MRPGHRRTKTTQRGSLGLARNPCALRTSRVHSGKHPGSKSAFLKHAFREVTCGFCKGTVPSEVSKRGWRKGGCRHKMSQIHFLTTTGRSGSKRHLDEAVWVTTALVFGCCARLEHDMCITLRRITSSNRCLWATDFDPRRKAQRGLLSMLPKAPALPKIDEQTVKIRFCYSKGCLRRWGHIGVKRT